MNRYLVTLMRFSISLIPLGIFAGAALLLVQGLQIDQAQACRDCPFPTPMASLHWRLPSGNSDVVLQEINLGGRRVQSVVRLLDARTGELLAIGYLEHQRGRKRIKVDMTDMAGGQMTAEILFTKSNRDEVKIKITCLKCNLQSEYLN